MDLPFFHEFCTGSGVVSPPPPRCYLPLKIGYLVEQYVDGAKC